MGDSGSYGGAKRGARSTDPGRSRARRASFDDVGASTTRMSSNATGAGRSGPQGTKPARAARRTTVPNHGRAGNPARASLDAAPASAAKGSAKRRGKRKRPKRSLFKRVTRIGLIVVLSLALLATIGGFVFYQRAKLPGPNADFTTQTTHLYFRDGTTPLGTLAIQNRTAIPYADMPQVIKDAVVAAEDRTFWTNQGVDFKGMARAFWNILQGKNVQGGSTITQQYIKIRYLSSDQTLTRKLNELALAMKMNKATTKASVLEGYLNTIYFGRGAYGIQAAAQTYFGVDAKNLTVAQSVVLASVLNNPSMYDPANGTAASAALLNRYNWALDSMVTMGSLNQADHDANYGKLPNFLPVKVSDVYGGTNGFLIRMVEDELAANGFTPDQINGGGLTIVTTFDPQLQQAAVNAAQSNVAQAAAAAAPLLDGNGNYMRDASGNRIQPDPNNLHVGLASIGVGTGEVLALYGGNDFVANSRNWATTPRYAASTFKVWGAVAGLRHGFGLNSVLRGSTFTPTGDLSPVQNDSGAQYGPVTLKTAIVDSINTSFVDLISQVPNGEAELIKAANDAGVPEHPSWAPQLNRLVLGEGEVSPLDNATGYATLANNGVRNQTHVVREVKDATGKVVYSGNVKGTQAIEDTVARDLTSALKGAVASSTVSAVGGRDVAGKTGTEGVAVGQSNAAGNSTATAQITRSAWLAGYTKQIATAVMMVAGDSGNDNLDVYKKPGNSAFYGAGYPTTVWNDYMAVATQGQPKVSFDPAANIKPTVSGSLAPTTSSWTPPPATSQATNAAPPAQAATQPATTAPPIPVPTSSQPPPPPTSQPPANTSAPVTTGPKPTTSP